MKRLDEIKISPYTIPKMFLIGYLVYNCALTPVGFYIPRLSLLLLVASVLSIVLVEKQGLRLIRFREFDLLFAFVLSSAVIGIMIAEDRTLVVQQIVFLAEFLIVAYCISFVSYRTGKADIIPWAFLIGSVVFAIFMLRGKAVLTGRRLSLSEDFNTNTLGVFLMFGVWSLLKLCGRIKRVPLSILFSVAGSALFFYLIIQTGSRKSTIGFIALFLMWIVFVLRTRMSKERRAIRFIAVVLLMGAIYYIAVKFRRSYFLAGDTIIYRMQSLEDTEGSWTIRFDMVLDALKVFIRNPIFGVGLNNYRLYSTYASYSHNTYVEVLACTGLLGASLFFSLLFSAVKSIFVQARSDVKKGDNNKEEDAYYVTLAILFLSICLTQICIYNRNLMLIMTQLLVVSILIRRNNSSYESIK